MRLQPAIAALRRREINPIVVKELRQAVRNWFVTGAFLLLLAVLFFTTVGFLLGEELQQFASTSLGRQVFGALFGILALVCLGFVPLYTGSRIAAERVEHNMDMLYATTLSPARIIRGKLLSAVYVAVLFYSACMPFMVFTYLLRGVDLPSVFVALAMLFLVNVVVVQFAILLGCLQLSRPLKILMGLIVGILMLWVMGGMTFGLLMFGWSGAGSRLMTWIFWQTALITVSIGAAIFGLLHLGSIALISPQSANRALPLRLYITGVWLLGGGISIAWAWNKPDPDYLGPWVLVTLLTCLAALVVCVCEQDTRSQRVRRAIPEPLWKRVPAFFFFNGPGAGILWATMLFAATFIIARLAETLIVNPATPGYSVSLHNFISQCGAAFLYGLAHALTGLFIHRRFLSNRPSKAAGAIAVMIPALWMLIPNLFLFFTKQLTWNSLGKRHLGNIFNLMTDNADRHIQAHLLFGFIWVAVALLLNLRWFITQVRSFTPHWQKPPPLEAKTTNEHQ